MLEKKNILGVGTTSATIDDILEYIIRGLEKDSKKYFIVTPNPEILTLAHKDTDYRDILNKAEIAVSDGVGVIIAGKILGKPLKARVTGVDLLENLCSLVSEKPITVGFLGGSAGVAEKTAECLLAKYPHLKISFVGSEWPEDNLGLDHKSRKTQNKTQSNAETINSLVPRSIQHSLELDILFVALGAPKQEIWISKNLDKIPVKIAVGVGGAFDYISGIVPRAPLLIRKIGLEWLFRLMVQPWRLKRQIALLEFIFLLLKEKITGNKRIQGKVVI